VYRKIVVCLDGSALAEEVIPYALEQARRGGGELILLYVRTPVDRRRSWTDLEHSVKVSGSGVAGAYLAGLAERLGARGIHVEHATVSQRGRSLADAIIGFARESHADAIALTPHGRGRRIDRPLGAVASSVLRKTTVPVLVTTSR